jgi:CubicO group peptidase (beta-lactamase class C family)
MMRERFFAAMVLLIMLFLYLPLSAQGYLSMKKFRKYIYQVMDVWKVPGVAVGVIYKGNVILAEGYGYRDVEKMLPANRHTIFAIGSSTKAFTTLTMGILVDEGKLDWEQPVKNYLPDFEMYDPYVSEHMTPRDLVIHNSGLPRHDSMWYGSKRTRKELYDVLHYLEPSKGFRSAYQYQNLMYMTAGYLVGRITKSSWEEVVQKRILDPLGMTSTNFSVNVSQKSDNYALPYEEEEEKIKQVPFYSGFSDVHANFGPAGSISSNITDMLKWVKLHLQEGKWNDLQIINKSTLQQIHTPQIIAGGTVAKLLGDFKEFSCPTYGMGWFIHHFRGHKILHHGGNIDGFSAMVSFMPENKSGVVVLTNKGGTFLTMAILFHVYDSLLGIKPAPWSLRFKTEIDKFLVTQKAKKDEEDKFRKKNTNPTHPLTEFAGEFEHPAYGSLFITVKNNTLHFEYNKFSSPLNHFHYNVFNVEEGLIKGLKFQFFLNEKGDIDRVSVPLQSGVNNIIFHRAPEKKMLKKEFLERFVGEYVYEETGMLGNIMLKGEKQLVLELPGQPQYELVPYKDTTFNIKGLSGFSVEFVLDKEGNVTGLIAHQPNGSFNIKRKTNK